MTKRQEVLVEQARESLDAARVLTQTGHHGFAAARAYYSMFYVAEAFLAGKGLSFSKHSGVIPPLLSTSRGPRLSRRNFTAT